MTARPVAWKMGTTRAGLAWRRKMKNKFLIMFAAAIVVTITVGVASAATYTVTKIADTNDGVCDSDCSLREAVALANASVDNDTIQFDFPLFNSPQTIVLSGGEIVVANNGTLTISGPGADRLTLDGNQASRILTIGTSATANVSGIRFTRGNGVGALNTGRGGAVYVVGGTLTMSNSILTGNTAANGGAFNNAASTAPAVPATATYINCVFSNNSSTSTGGAGQNFSTSFLTIEGSTFTGNSGGTTTGGGALQANGQVRITNSTFSGNTATAGPGGAIQSNGTLLLLTNVTISGNTSVTNGGGLHRATTNVNGFIRNSIIAGNNGAAASPDVTNSAAGLASQGNNIIGNTGTSTGWVASDLLNTNPLLTPIGNYGGLGQTFAIRSNSPAVNGGQNCVIDLSCTANNPPSAVTNDQRGAARTAGATVDIGAFESSTSYVATLPNATIGIPYQQVIAPNNGAFNYTVSSGNLPGGLALTTSLADTKNADPEAIVAIEGTPSSGGTNLFTITIAESVLTGGSQANINYSLTVTGAVANVFISGRVLDGGLGIVPNALVLITDGASVNMSTRSNSFGNYRFSGLPPGVPYTITVQTKGLSFAPAIIAPSGNVTGFDLSPTP
jgi:CSLREA domain-containing protein